MEVVRQHTGLSYSSYTLFTSCAYKYWLKKIAKVDIDEDAEESTEAFDVGKAFHQVLEDCKHELAGVKYETVQAVTDKYKLDPHTHTPMIYAMLKKYKAVHEEAGLKAHACEVPVETPNFYGVIDVVLTAPTGEWWIGDMKTTAAMYNNIAPSLPMNPQLNMYAYHCNILAKAVDLDPLDFQGCRYRVTTKSKLVRKKTEETKDFIERVALGVKSFDFIIPRETMRPDLFASLLADAKNHIDTYKDTPVPEQYFQRNFGNCMSYFRPCENWSRCHGNLRSKMPELKVIQS